MEHSANRTQYTVQSSTVPEKSALPTPTMMMDIGWADAAMMAACTKAHRSTDQRMVKTGCPLERVHWVDLLAAAQP